MSSLQTYGDDFEKIYYDEFIKEKFPNYEKFWALYIFPLRSNPRIINHYITNENENENYIAQLHYSILRSLIRSYTISQKLNRENHHHYHIDDFIDSMSRIYCALDMAFEFLQRINFHNKEDIYCRKTSDYLRKKWVIKNIKIEQIRHYRNLLVHGCLLPSILIGGKYFMPKLGHEKKMNSWRESMSSILNHEKRLNYFESIDIILSNAFETTVQYLNSEWDNCIKL